MRQLFHEAEGAIQVPAPPAQGLFYEWSADDAASPRLTRREAVITRAECPGRC